MHNASDRSNSQNQTPKSGRKITISAARKMLGMLSRNYSDEDLRGILDILYAIAEEGFETCGTYSSTPPKSNTSEL